ncbi:hypothetical protein B0H10DRAFT_815018 [Mycena sp. CBHHK59/15]|nr:hypothetical protein B0H10DRAFT_815018 [Mycena sp. CBHHK59/15]
MSFIAKGRLWREKIIVDALYTADVQPAPAYAPKILAAFAAHDLPPPGPPNDSEILQDRKRPASALEDLPTMVPRHLEIMAFDSPPDARKLKDVPSAAEFLAAAEDLFRAILDAFRRRILHRDISVNNILVADNQLWSTGRLDDTFRSRRPLLGEALLPARWTQCQWRALRIEIRSRTTTSSLPSTYSSRCSLRRSYPLWTRSANGQRPSMHTAGMTLMCSPRDS